MLVTLLAEKQLDNAAMDSARTLCMVPEKTDLDTLDVHDVHPSS